MAAASPTMITYLPISSPMQMCPTTISKATATGASQPMIGRHAVIAVLANPIAACPKAEPKVAKAAKMAAAPMAQVSRARGKCRRSN